MYVAHWWAYITGRLWVINHHIQRCNSIKFDRMVMDDRLMVLWIIIIIITYGFIVLIWIEKEKKTKRLSILLKNDTEFMFIDLPQTFS